MQYELDDISLADSPVISTRIDLTQKTITIISSACFYVPAKSWLAKTILTITGWSEFTCYYYIYDNDTQSSYEKFVKEQAEIETFELVQEVMQIDNNLKLCGISEETHNWMEYRFTDAKVHVEADERENDSI